MDTNKHEFFYLEIGYEREYDVTSLSGFINFNYCH